MAALSVQVPYPVFYDRDGQPLDNGNIYIGVANLDPVTNPLQVYYDEALTITASQPLKTSNGYIYRNGTPAQLYVDAVNFSITVKDAKNTFVYSFPDGTGLGVGANGVEYDPPFTGALTSGYTVADKLAQYITPEDFGAVGDGVIDDTVAIQAAIDAALGGNIRRLLLSSKYLITDIDITKKYYCGLIIEGQNSTHQPAGVGTLIVSGAASQGIDISGTSGLVFRNIAIRGDASAAPRCGLFAQRVSGSQESYGHIFDNVRFYGQYTKAAVYNYAGEFWDFRNGTLWCEGSGGRAGYFTSTNSLGLTTKFQTPDNTVTPLTITSFRKTDINSDGVEAIWFEQQTAAGGDRTIQNVLFDGCYLRSRGGASYVLRFTECFGGLTIRNCTDESYATTDPAAAGTFLKIEGARQFARLDVTDNAFYTKTYIVDANIVVGFVGQNNWIQSGAIGSKIWRFATLNNANYSVMYENEAFQVTSAALLVSVMPANNTASANISLPSNRMNQAYFTTYGGNPTGVINGEVRGRLIFDTWYGQMRMLVGTPAGADSFGWRVLEAKEQRGSLPASGNYQLGQIIWKTAPAAGGKIGWVCTATGTFGTLVGITADTTNGSTTVTVNSNTGLAIGNLVTIAGVSGQKTITAINGTTLTINTAAGASVSGAAVAFVAPTFKEWGAIDA